MDVAALNEDNDFLRIHTGKNNFRFYMNLLNFVITLILITQDILQAFSSYPEALIHDALNPSCGFI